MMNALRALVTGGGAFAAMTAEEAETALNAATIPTPGRRLVQPDEFVDLFTPAEFTAIEDSADAVVRKLVFRLRTRQAPIDLASATVQQGLAYMASINLLTPQRAAEIGTVAPGPMISMREQIGWREPRIWAADVVAARLRED